MNRHVSNTNTKHNYIKGDYNDAAADDIFTLQQQKTIEYGYL